MTRAPWRYALASVVGTSHLRQALPCQDASTCQVVTTTAGDPVLVAAVADGAGSAERAEIGSHLACSVIRQAASELLAAGGSVHDVTWDCAREWVAKFQSEVSICATAEGRKPRDFACTLLAAVVGSDCAAFFQIGDGAIVVSWRDVPEHYVCVVWPQKGEYENVTYFATDEAAVDQMHFEFSERPVDEIAMFSDGLQRLALHFSTESVHAPFFVPMFKPLLHAQEGSLQELSRSLESFLGSKQVVERTDDDKTLILASRRPALS